MRHLTAPSTNTACTPQQRFYSATNNATVPDRTRALPAALFYPSPSGGVLAVGSTAISLHVNIYKLGARHAACASSWAGGGRRRHGAPKAPWAPWTDQGWWPSASFVAGTLAMARSTDTGWQVATVLLLVQSEHVAAITTGRLHHRGTRPVPPSPPGQPGSQQLLLWRQPFSGACSALEGKDLAGQLSKGGGGTCKCKATLHVCTAQHSTARAPWHEQAFGMCLWWRQADG